MIAPRALAPQLAVAGQVRVEDMAGIATRYAMLINNRPDGEEPGQPLSAELEAAARKLG
jgi:sulfide:quinone oxidoreductase